MNFIEKNTKKVALVLGIATALSAVTTVYAASNTDGWHDGVYMVDGKVKTAWLFEETGAVYYLNYEGRAVTGWKTINESTYYFNANGERVSGDVVIDGHKYAFQKNGKLLLGWQDENTTYYNQYGVKVTGEQKIDGKTYNFDANGNIQKGWMKLNGKKVYFKEDGSLATSETKIDGKKYNFQSNGTLKSGWTHENDMIQYYNKYGYRLKGWQTIKGKKYLFSKNGNAYTDTKKDGYKFDKKGVAKKIKKKAKAETTTYETAASTSYSAPKKNNNANLNPAGHAGNGSAASIASSYVGYNYVWGGASPAGFDCSGLIYYAYNQVGVSVPRSGYGQAGMGSAVSYNNMQYGDVIVWDGGSHVSIYIGGGQMVHAANPSMGVIVSGVSEWASYGQSITGIRRV